VPKVAAVRTEEFISAIRSGVTWSVLELEGGITISVDLSHVLVHVANWAAYNGHLVIS